MNVSRPNDEGKQRSLHGLSRTLLNMVTGVTTGFTKVLEAGVGYRAQMQGSNLQLALTGLLPPRSGYAPEGISFTVEGPRVNVEGIDKEKVGRGRQHPQAASTRAVQGQGHPLFRRACPPQGWQSREGRQVMAKATSVLARSRRHARVRKSVSGKRCAPAPERIPQFTTSMPVSSMT